ncbi:MAG: signal transduction histidine kinase [Pseudoalteromonas tetraodonis]
MPSTTARYRSPLRRLILACCLWLTACHPQSVCAQEAPALVRAVSGPVRDLEAGLATIRKELETLPLIPSGSNGGSLGFHGGNGVSGNEWVMVDLGRDRPIDAVVLVPVSVAYSGAGDYGFPIKLRIEFSSDAEFASKHRLPDSMSRLPPAPAAIFDAGGHVGRYIRVTATIPWTTDQRTVFALGEMLVFSEGRNIAPGKTVTASQSIEAEPLWSADNLVDGQSGLGSAVTSERAAVNGYHSEIEALPDVEKWVQVDLGATTAIDEVRVQPARPIDWAESHGFGFPRRFRVESSLDEEFSDPRVLLDRTDQLFPNPGDNPIVIPLDQIEARYVRFTASELWKREVNFVFALAELQVFAGSENVALGKTVTALDEVEGDSWSKAGLVDGFDSRHRLKDDELGWLRGIVRRQHLVQEQAAAEKRLTEEIGAVVNHLIWLASVIGIGLVAIAGIVLVRGRAARKHETDRLRERIASDLHDEIGSSLGTIALLSEIGGGEGDLAEINRVARETAAAMQDIAWVIRGGHDNVDDLLLRMREVAAAAMQKINFTFNVTPDEISDRKISLEFKRNTLLFFKEALHNLIRHSRATKAAVQIDIARDLCCLNIDDNGVGFDLDSQDTQFGSGLKNMRKRAEALGGECSISSELGAGTRIQLSVPFH